MDSTIPLLAKSKISSLSPSSVTVQPGLCQTWLETKLFSHAQAHMSNFTPVIQIQPAQLRISNTGEIIVKMFNASNLPGIIMILALYVAISCSQTSIYSLSQLFKASLA